MAWQALVKGMDVVYIYHDTIDEAGHLEKSIFGACDEAIDELKNVVRIITNEFGGANILMPPCTKFKPPPFILIRMLSLGAKPS